MKEKKQNVAEAFTEAKDSEKMNLNLTKILKEAKKSNEFVLKRDEKIIIN